MFARVAALQPGGVQGPASCGEVSRLALVAVC